MNLVRMHRQANRHTLPRGPVPWHPRRRQPAPGDRMRKHVLTLAVSRKTSDDSSQEGAP